MAHIGKDRGGQVRQAEFRQNMNTILCNSACGLRTDIQIKMFTVGYSLPEKHKDRKNERATIISSTCQKELSLDNQTVLTRARCLTPDMPCFTA